MKKFTKVIALLLVAMLVLGVGVTAYAATYKYVKTQTSGSSVTLREKASTSAKSLGLVKDGTKVTYLSKTGDWYKVTIGGKTGYILTSFLTGTAPSGSSSSTSSLGSKGAGTINTKTYLYISASTTSTKLKTLAKGTSVTVTQVSSSGNWGKLTYDGKTGYVPMKYVTNTGSSSSSSGAATSDGIITGVYTSSSITAPSSTVSTKQDFWNAINYNLSKYKTSFSINVQNAQSNWMPARFVNLEYAYMEKIVPSGSPNGTMAISFSVTYSDAGKVIAYYKNGTSIPSGNGNAVALQKKVASILSNASGKSDYAKIVYFHDYIVENTAYKDGKNSAFDVLVSGLGQCQGYAEAMGVLLSCAKIENRLVWAKSKITGTGTHGFNKVKLDGKWYNVDCTVDDPIPNTPGRVKHDYLLVTDTVSKQRYNWETSRYPAATTSNNWHHRNNLVAKSQSELVTLIKKAIQAGDDHVSIWVEDYSPSKYTPSAVSGVKSFSKTGAASTYSTFATALYIALK